MNFCPETTHEELFGVSKVISLEKKILVRAFNKIACIDLEKGNSIWVMKLGNQRLDSWRGISTTANQLATFSAPESENISELVVINLKTGNIDWKRRFTTEERDPLTGLISWKDAFWVPIKSAENSQLLGLNCQNGAVSACIPFPSHIQSAGSFPGQKQTLGLWKNQVFIATHDAGLVQIDLPRKNGIQHFREGISQFRILGDLMIFLPAGPNTFPIEFDLQSQKIRTLYKVFKLESISNQGQQILAFWAFQDKEKTSLWLNPEGHGLQKYDLETQELLWETGQGQGWEINQILPFEGRFLLTGNYLGDSPFRLVQLETGEENMIEGLPFEEAAIYAQTVEEKLIWATNQELIILKSGPQIKKNQNDHKKVLQSLADLMIKMITEYENDELWEEYAQSFRKMVSNFKTHNPAWILQQITQILEGDGVIFEDVNAEWNSIFNGPE